MIAVATRQDLQSALERTRSSIIGSMFSRQDAQSVVAQLRGAIAQDLHYLHAENQQTTRQSQTQHDQIMARIVGIEHSLHEMQLIMTKFLESQSHHNNPFYH